VLRGSKSRKRCDKLELSMLGDRRQENGEMEAAYSNQREKWGKKKTNSA